MGINRSHFQGFADNRVKVLLLKLACRQIDRDWMQDQALALPFVDLLADGPYHPFPDRYDQTCVLKNRNEFERRHEPMCRMLPAKERLEPGDFPTRQTRLWLVVKHKFTPCQRAPELCFDFQASH